MNIRKIAMRLLSDYESNGAYANLSLSSHLLDPLGASDRAALTALFYTTVERKLTLDFAIGTLAARSVEDMDPYTRNLLRLGLCQIYYMEKIPDFAAVNETVKLARSTGERSLVNGVLRAAVRAGATPPMPDRKKNEARYLSVFYSLPLWIVRHYLDLFSSEEAERLFSAINEQPPLCVTVNTTRISVDAYLEALESVGIRAHRSPRVPRSVIIEDTIVPRGLYGYSEGFFFVQDVASALVTLALDAREGERVIDVCACPGGKSFGTAIAMGDAGEILSFDLHESKLPLIRDGAERLRLSSVHARMQDATHAREELFERADRVIVDVPCSGLGVLRKKPDLRYKSQESIANLPELGYEILSQSVRYVRQGGTLVFSTCTTRREENEDVLERFLSEHPDFYTVPFSDGEYTYDSGICKTYPHRDGCDGFFIAKMMRKEK